MSVYELVTLFVLLLGGFWKLSRQLASIEIALSSKVSHRDCDEYRQGCPCHKMIEKLESRIETLHPPAK